ncbi:MAG: M16 family metallopeptidase [Leptospirales bacterium]
MFHIENFKRSMTVFFRQTMRVALFLAAFFPFVFQSSLAQADMAIHTEFHPSPVLHVYPNGLRLIYVDNPYSPIVTFQIWYRVGSLYEKKHKTGISHFLEHMMFTGTPLYPHGALDKEINAIGGESNAFTDYDFTAYFENTAPSYLSIAMNVESDRMFNLALSTDQIDRERRIVLEERRNDYDDPAQKLVEQVYAKAFRKHPYHNPVIGWEPDIKHLSQSDLRKYYRTYYMPNNATIVVVGPVNGPQLVDEVGKKFGTLPAGTAPPPVTSMEPPQRELRFTVLHKPAMLPVTMMAFHVPNFKNPDSYPLTVLSTLLSGGRSSILFQKMVYNNPVAVDAEGDYEPMSKGPALFYFYAQGLPKVSPPLLRHKFEDIIKTLKTTPVTQTDLDRAKKQVISGFLMGQESTFGLGMLLGEMASIGVPLDYIDTYVDKIRSVTSQDIQRVAQTYLKTSNETVGYLYPSGVPKKQSFARPNRIVR